MNSEINPSSKLNEILEIFKNYNITVYTNKDENYDFLSEGHFSIKIKNPNNDDDIYIDLEDEISVFFSDWHAHYYPYEEYYETAIQDVKDLLENKKYALCLYVNGKWFGSTLKSKIIENKEEAIKEASNFFSKSNRKYFVNKMNKDGVTIECKYCNNSKNIKFKIESGIIK